MRILKAVSIAMTGFALGTSALSAQSATIQVTATVLSQITITGTSLVFGNVTPGVSKTVLSSAAAAGTFTITAAANAGVQLSFTLPANLTSGANTMPIGTWTGRYNPNNVQASAIAFTPSASAQNATVSAVSKLYVWIGATVTPAAAQAAGAYTGSIVMNVVYQ